jgi:hypothetical protein
VRVNEENQKCLPCDGMDYSKMIGIEYTTSGDYSCTEFLLKLQVENSTYIIESMEKCEALKKECIICNEDCQ